MKERGSICLTEFWSLKQKKEYIKANNVRFNKKGKNIGFRKVQFAANFVVPTGTNLKRLRHQAKTARIKNRTAN